MGLISALKYQISTPPTLDEVLALPPELILQWVEKSHFSTTELSNTLFQMNTWYNSGHEQHRGSVIDFTEDLRRLIREYEE